MMRRVALLVFCGVVAGGFAQSASAEQPPGDSGSTRRGPAATRPALEAQRKGMVSTMPFGGHPMPADRNKGGPWRNRPEGVGRRGPDSPSPGPMFDPARPGGYHGGPDEPPLTPQEREELLAFVKERFPELHRRLQRAEQDDPAAYGRSLRRLAGPALKMMRLSKTDPQLADALIAEQKVEMEIVNLQASYEAKRPDADRERVRARVRELVEKRFDLRQQRLKLEIQAMRKRLDEAMAKLSQQSANRSQLIEGETRRTIERMESGAPDRPKYPPGEGAAHAFPGQPAPEANQR